MSQPKVIINWGESKMQYDQGLTWGQLSTAFNNGVQSNSKYLELWDEQTWRQITSRDTPLSTQTQYILRNEEEKLLRETYHGNADLSFGDWVLVGTITVRPSGEPMWTPHPEFKMEATTGSGVYEIAIIPAIRPDTRLCVEVEFTTGRLNDKLYSLHGRGPANLLSKVKQTLPQNTERRIPVCVRWAPCQASQKEARRLRKAFQYAWNGTRASFCGSEGQYGSISWWTPEQRYACLKEDPRIFEILSTPTPMVVR